ncbi:MAG TPA: hypothetical protein VIX63_12460, partial [Vicinamibacterales bacterium]
MSRSRVVAVAAAACLAAAGVVLHSNYTWAAQEQANVVPQANEQLEIAIGFKIAPVPLKFAP